MSTGEADIAGEPGKNSLEFLRQEKNFFCTGLERY